MQIYVKQLDKVFLSVVVQQRQSYRYRRPKRDNNLYGLFLHTALKKLHSFKTYRTLSRSCSVSLFSENPTVFQFQMYNRSSKNSIPYVSLAVRKFFEETQNLYNNKEPCNCQYLCCPHMIRVGKQYY